MKKCIFCGRVADDSVKFCPDCGRNEFVPTEPEVQPDGGQRNAGAYRPEDNGTGYYGSFPPPDGKPKKEKKAGGRKKVLIALAVIGAIVVVSIISGSIRSGRERRLREEYARLSADTAAEQAVPETTTAEPTTKAPETTTEEKTTAEPTTKAPETTTEKAKKSETDVDPEFREMLESYEAFYDQYVAFMKNYDATDFSMLGEYSKLMMKLAEWNEKIDAMDEDEMTDAELALYLEVTGRVLGKLATIGE